MSAPNAEQRTRWNEVIGPKWVEVIDDVEAHLREVGDLALAHAAARPGEAVLEIGSGPGSMAVRLARAVLPGGHVLGVDIAKPMIEAAEARVRQAGLGNVSFRLADAQAEKLPPAAFDLAFSRFGVMFFDDPAAAFANIRTAMKPNGRLAFACWGPLKRNPHWAIPWGIATRHLGRPEPLGPHAPGPMAFDDPDYVRDVLGRAGWRAVTITEAEPALADDPMDRLVHFATTMGPSGGLIAERAPAPEVLAAIRAEIEAAFAPFERGGRVRVPGLIYLVGARA